MKTYDYMMHLSDGTSWMLKGSTYANGQELWERIKLDGGVSVSPTQYIPANGVARIRRIDYE